jgi:hypothetical protein
MPARWPLLAALAALLATAACSENRPFERENTGPQAKLAVPNSITPPISVRGIDGAPDSWKLAERVAEALRSRDIPASSAARSRSAFVLKGQLRPGAERNGRSRVEVVWTLYDGSGRKVGEVTQMAAVPGVAFKGANEGVVEALADAAAESIAPLVPSSSVHLADATETGERRPNDRSKIEERDRVTAVGRMKNATGVAKNLLEPPKREAKVEAKADSKTDRTRRTAAAPPPAERAAPPPARGDKNAITAVGRYEGASPLSRNLLQPGGDVAKPLPPPQRPPKQTVTSPPDQPPADAEESLGVGPMPASDKRVDKPRASVSDRRPPQRAEADTAKADVTPPPDRPRQYAETPPERNPDRTPRTPPARAGAWQYWLQLVSHRDEAMSRTELQRIQGSVGALLANVGNRIQRADLGTRGIYYRVQVGPFASATEAGQLCAQLKARQIDCFLATPEPAVRTTQPPATPPAQAAPPAQPPAQAKPTEPKKPVTAQPKPPAEKPKDTAGATPKKPDEKPAAKPETKPPPGSSAEKPDLPTHTAPGLPGVLD